jgi:choline dehydrogenase-like flavoprotein
MTGTTVAKINLKGGNHGYYATGVTLTNGTIINTNQEVILSAGSFLSPGVLKVSGMGNKSILTGAGIKQLINYPGVGENLQDHIRKSYPAKDDADQISGINTTAWTAGSSLMS